MSSVYFLRPVGQEGPVKIGYSRLPLERLRQLMSWSPLELEIAATLPGGRQLEGRFHSAFVDHHVRGEWFGPAAEITAAIDAIRAGAFDPESLPEFVTLRAGWKPSPESIRAGLFNRKVQSLARAGVVVPDHVEAALHTYKCSPEEVARRREIVREFVQSQQAGAA